MKQLERECPVCQSNGIHRLLELHQINLTTAVYLCKYKKCTYPGAFPFEYVSRNLCDIFDNDSDSESSLEDYDVDISSISSDTDSTISSTYDVSQCSIVADTGLVDNSASHITNQNAVNSITCNAQVDMPELEISTSNNCTINSVECPKNILKLSIKLGKSSAVSNKSKSNVDDTTEGSNDDPTIDISQSNDVNLQTINISNDTIQSNTYEIQIETPELDTGLLDIENIPVVLAESEEGKKLLDSVSQTNVSSPVSATPKRGVNKALINKPGTCVNKAQHIMKLLKRSTKVLSKQDTTKCENKLVNIVPEAACKAVLDYRKNTTKQIKTINRIPGKHVSNDIASSASCFSGFQFKSTIIKYQETNDCKREQTDVNEKKNVSNNADMNVKNTNNISDSKSVNECNVEEIALNDFFDNIDKMQPTDFTDQLVDNEDVEEWLESLYS